MPVSLEIARTPATLRAALAPARVAARTVALVPTMGALHDGHLALVAAARDAADVVVVSLFVNPTQFDDASDLDAYPRDEATDASLVAAAGADLLFAPGAKTLYPAGFATSISVGGVAEPLEGAVRGPGHFAGVATVVAKLLIACAPDFAAFGEKDAQQLAVIRRLIVDLGLPVTVIAVPTVREPDGLARSSRNARLAPTERRRAVALITGLRAAERAFATGELDARQLERTALEAMAPFGVEPEYLAVVDSETFASLDAVLGPARLAVAAHVGGVRLIDNVLLHAPRDPLEVR